MKTFIHSFILFLVAGFTIATTSLQAQAEDPCQLEGFYYMGTYNGHYYYLSSDCYYPADANAAAEAAGGYLATISDAGENEFVGVAAFYITAWIGFTDLDDEGNFRWVTGEPVTFINWSDGEPNNCCGGEHWTTTNWGWNENGPAWNDEHDVCYGFVMEVGDDDCDGVPNICDVCPGGDDNGPCTGEGGTLNVPANWICSNNNNNEKYMVCHEGNTICVSASAVATHLAHGDFLGPCTGCGNDGQAFVAPIHNIDFETEKPQVTDFTMSPNPSNGDFKIELNHSDAGKLEIINQNGQLIRSIDFKNNHELNINIDVPGVYFIRLMTEEQLITKKITVVR